MDGRTPFALNGRTPFALDGRNSFALDDRTYWTPYFETESLLISAKEIVLANKC